MGTAEDESLHARGEEVLPRRASMEANLLSHVAVRESRRAVVAVSLVCCNFVRCLRFALISVMADEFDSS
jgi:hypothetical protein